MLVDHFAVLAHVLIALVIAALVAGVAERALGPRVLPMLLSIIAALSMVQLAVLVANHIWFPFQLDLMEGVVMQHARRALHGQSIYPMPTPEFVPLAYNALFYLLAVPFLLVFGNTLPVLRVVSVIGMLGSAAAIFVMVRAYTRSSWWSAIATGLFCASYSAMDAYLDTAHSDAWLLCAVLWGTYLVGRSSRGSRLGGVATLVSAFWFKQHGAIFVGAALVFLTWDEGLRKAFPYWLVALVFGAGLYLVAPGSLLGPDFHFFTWHVPSGWSEIGPRTLPRLLYYLAAFYPVLAFVSAWGAWRALRTRTFGILQFQLAAAGAAAFMGSLDPGSSYNVFIPLAAFLILCGTIELAALAQRLPTLHGIRPSYALAALAFATLVFDPRDYWLPATARMSYAELQSTIRQLPGKVYAPGIGDLSDGPQLYPGAHWVALDDIMRGPHRTASDSALAHQLLDPVRHPAVTTFILTSDSLETLPPPVNELVDSYALVQDYGERFVSLTALPRRYDHQYPRYLYRNRSVGVASHAP